MLTVEQNVLLAPFTTFGIGGPADYFVQVDSVSQLQEAVSWARENNQNFFVLGAGANIVVSDKGYRGLVIKNNSLKFSINGLELVADSGALIEDIIHKTQELGLSGFEHFAGIPSTVGGALWQNLHFLSPDRSTTMFIADIVESAVILHENGTTEKVGVEYFQFGYDKSILHTTTDIVLSATFRLEKKSPEEIQNVIEENLLWRGEKHPKDASKMSAGSVFKQIEGFGAGRLIEKVGLKGKQIGGAQISTVHANFIVNTGEATAQDVIDLIELVKKTVKEELHLDMKPEIKFVGEFGQ